MSKPRKILVADDDQITREIIGAILTKAGHEVVFAEDGKAAVEMAASETPDLVFIDGLMPKMHGFLACKAIKELPSPPKVILLTGIYTKPTYKWEAKDAFNADDLLKKPATAEALSACIDKHLPDAIGSEVADEAALIVAPTELADEVAIVVDAQTESADEVAIVVDAPTESADEAAIVVVAPTEVADEVAILVDAPNEVADKAWAVVDTSTNMADGSWALLDLPTEEAAPLASVKSEAL